MNVLILMPKIPDGQEYMFPLGIACVSAALKKEGYNVFTMNLNFYDDWEKELCSCIKTNTIEVVGTGGLTADYQQISRILHLIAEEFPDVIKVLGGGIVTASTHIIFDLFPCLDIAMQGEGEVAWLKLIEALEEKKNLKHVPNILYRNENEIVVTKTADDIADLDELPFPDYEGFGYREAMKHMEKSGYWIGDRPAFVLSSRSCPYNCTFCFHTAGKKYRRASLDYVFNQIDWMIENYNCKSFNFSDELFGLDEQYVLDFCDRIQNKNINWSVSMRVDCITEQTAERMSETGCRWILYGIESADDGILKSMNKKITQSQINEALRITRKNNIGVIGYLIFGDHKENAESVRTSLDWWVKNLKYGIGMNMIRAFPGSLNYDRCVKNGRIASETEFIKKGCPVINTTAFSDDEYFGLYAKIEGYKMYHFYTPEDIRPVGCSCDNNKFTFRYSCPHCHESNYSTSAFFQNKHLICEKCNQVMHVSLARYFQGITNTVYKDLINTTKTVLIHTDDEASYQCAFSLVAAGYKVYVKSNGKNLFEHRALWGVETVFAEETKTIIANNNVFEVRLEEDNDFTNRIISAFSDECCKKFPHFKITEKG